MKVMPAGMESEEESGDEGNYTTPPMNGRQSMEDLNGIKDEKETENGDPKDGGNRIVTVDQWPRDRVVAPDDDLEGIFDNGVPVSPVVFGVLEKIDGPFFRLMKQSSSTRILQMRRRVLDSVLSMKLWQNKKAPRLALALEIVASISAKKLKRKFSIGTELNAYTPKMIARKRYPPLSSSLGRILVDSTLSGSKLSK